MFASVASRRERGSGTHRGVFYFSGMRLTLRVQRGLARLVLRHLVGRMLLALLAEALLSLGNVHLRRGEGGSDRQRLCVRRSRASCRQKPSPNRKTPDRRPKRDARGVDDRRDALETRRRGRITHDCVTHHLCRSPSVCGGTESAPLRGRGEARERCFWAGSKTSFDYFHHICSRSSHDLYTICLALYTQLMVRFNYFV